MQRGRERDFIRSHLLKFITEGLCCLCWQWNSNQFLEVTEPCTYAEAWRIYQSHCMRAGLDGFSLCTHTFIPQLYSWNADAQQICKKNLLHPKLLVALDYLIPSIAVSRVQCSAYLQPIPDQILLPGKRWFFIQSTSSRNLFWNFQIICCWGNNVGSVCQHVASFGWCLSYDWSGSLGNIIWACGHDRRK